MEAPSIQRHFLPGGAKGKRETRRDAVWLDAVAGFLAGVADVRWEIEAGRRLEAVALRRALYPVQHPIDHHAGDADVEQDRERTSRDAAVLVEFRFKARDTVITASGSTAMAGAVRVNQIVK